VIYLLNPTQLELLQHIFPGRLVLAFTGGEQEQLAAALQGDADHGQHRHFVAFGAINHRTIRAIRKHIPIVRR
jgi:hypothetical protein